MQHNPPTAAPAAASGPTSPARAPRRLPDELVLMVAEWCSGLRYGRDATLATLCRLAKRFKAAVERVLYSSVVLVGGPLYARSTLNTLVHFPRYRQLVKRVNLSIRCASIADLAPEVISVLCSMPNVEEVRVADQAASPTLPLLLVHPTCRLRIYSAPVWTTADARFSRSHPRAFAFLEHMATDDSSALLAAAACPALSSLHIACGTDFSPARWARYSAALGNRLTSLSLHLEDESLGQVGDLSTLRRLEHLRLRMTVSGGRARLDRDGPAIMALMQSLPRSPSLVRLELNVDVTMSDGSRDPLVAFPIPASYSDILFAIPPQIRHLTLVTDAIPATIFATYLLSPLRPPALRTLRLGDDLGYGLSVILDDAECPHGALAGELERAGIEVTTPVYW
ncbi:hypothetical protein JCM9279_002790 [Rhodotorula babjevae]